MKTYDFDMILDTGGEAGSLMQADEFLDAVEDTLFEAFEGDVTPAFHAGMPILLCTMSAATVEEAVHLVAERVISLGLHPAQVLMRLNGAYLAA